MIRLQSLLLLPIDFYRSKCPLAIQRQMSAIIVRPIHITIPKKTAHISFRSKFASLHPPFRCDVAPTQAIPIVRRTADGRRELIMMRWRSPALQVSDG